MDDNQLKSIFDSYSPKLSDETGFFADLERSLDSVEIVKRKSLESKRQNRLSLAITAIIGFGSGVMFTLCFPVVEKLVGELRNLGGEMAKIVDNYGDCLVWATIGLATTAVTLLANDLSKGLIAKKHQKIHHAVNPAQHIGPKIEK